MSENSDVHHDEGFFERILNPHKTQHSNGQSETQDQRKDKEDHEHEVSQTGNEKEKDPFREYLKKDKELADDLRVYDRLI